MGLRYRKLNIGEQWSKRKLYLSNIKKRFFEMMITRFIIEQKMTLKFIVPNIALYFWMTLLSLTDMRNSLDTNGASLQAAIQSALNTIIIITVVLYIFIGVALTSFKQNQRDYLSLKVSIYMTVSFVYVIYPIELWSFSVWLAEIYLTGKVLISTGLVIIDVMFLILGGLVPFFYLKYRNTVITSSRLSSAAKGSELTIYFTTLFIQLLSGVGKVAQFNGVGVLIILISSIIMISNIYLLIRRRPFWDLQFNNLFVSCYICMYIAKFAFDVIPSRYKFVILYITSMSLPLVGKLTQSVNLTTSKIAIFDPKTSISDLYIGCIMCESVLSEGQAALEVPETRDMFFYYFSQWQSFLLQTKDGQQRPFPTTGDTGKLAEEPSIQLSILRRLNSITPTSKNSKLLMRLKLLFGLVVPTSNTMHLRSMLYELKKAGNKTLGESFDHFCFVKLYENKFDALYRLKDTDTINTRDHLSLKSIYDRMYAFISSNSIREKEEVVVLTVFEELGTYRSLVKLIKNEIACRCQLYEALLKEGKVSNRTIYNLNCAIMDSKEDVSSILNRYDFTRDHASYVYPCLIFYYSLIRNSIRKAEHLGHCYRRVLNEYNYQASPSKESRSLVERVSDMNSVSILTSMDKDSAGKIIECSPNYFEHLGVPADLEIVGKDINDWLPDSIAGRHRAAMLDFRYDQLQAAHGSVLAFRGFDGFLRKAGAKVRLFPSLQKSVCAVTFLRFDPRDPSTLVLVDRKMNIVEAESKFWSLLDLVNPQHDCNQITQISDSLSISIHMIAEYEGQIKNHNKSKQIQDKDLLKLRKEIRKTAKELCVVNKQCGWRYSVNECSEFFNKQGFNFLRTQVRVKKAFGVVFYQLFFELGEQHQFMTSLNTINQKSPTDSDDSNNSRRSGSEMGLNAPPVNLELDHLTRSFEAMAKNVHNMINQYIANNRFSIGNVAALDPLTRNLMRELRSLKLQPVQQPVPEKALTFDNVSHNQELYENIRKPSIMEQYLSRDISSKRSVNQKNKAELFSAFKNRMWMQSISKVPSPVSENDLFSQENKEQSNSKIGSQRFSLKLLPVSDESCQPTLATKHFDSPGEAVNTRKSLERSAAIREQHVLQSKTNVLLASSIKVKEILPVLNVRYA